jgi:hypothetical protein
MRRLDLYVEGPIKATTDGIYTFNLRGELGARPTQVQFVADSPIHKVDMTTQVSLDIARVMFFQSLGGSGLHPIHDTLRAAGAEAARISHRNTIGSEDDPEEDEDD